MAQITPASSSKDVHERLFLCLKSSKYRDFSASEVFWHPPSSDRSGIPSGIPALRLSDRQLKGVKPALFVAPARQVSGIGRQLLADARASRSMLQLTVYSANEPTIRSYETQGFVVLDVQLNKHAGHLVKVMRWVAEEGRG